MQLFFALYRYYYRLFSPTISFITIIPEALRKNLARAWSWWTPAP